MAYAPIVMEAFVHTRTVLLVCLLACAGCTSVKQEHGGYAYKVDIDGAGWSLEKQIKEAASVCRFKDHPPSTEGQLRYRMAKDQDLIKAILESNGFYDGRVNLYLDTMQQPALVEIKVWRGEQYRFRDVRLVFTDNRDAALKRIRPRIRRRRRVVAAELRDEEKRIEEQIQRKGYPFPTLMRRVVDVDHDARAVDLTLEYDPGSLASFGEVRVEGLEELNEKYIRRQVPWRTGDRYNAKDLEDFERKLLYTGLFSSVHVGVQNSAEGTNNTPVLIRLSERDKRTVRLGVNYSDIGPGAQGYWEHRSLFGGGEKLELSVAANPIKINSEVQLTRAGFLDANQYLVLNLYTARDNPEAYDADKITTSAMVLRDFTSRIQGGTGTGYKHSRVEQLSVVDEYAYVFFPLQLMYDSRNDRLNPVRGMQLFGRSAFFNDIMGAQSFLKTGLENRHYLMLWDRYRLSSALRLKLASIDGAAIERVPADERFYAGGGGSIRGYEYQKVGPQVDGTPAGGDKAVEFSAELRMQPGRRLGYVAFLDGGTVYIDKLRDYNRSLRYGAGLGIRWFTGIGPLRVDVAYPLNPTDEQVERVQLYISLGQAF